MYFHAIIVYRIFLIFQIFHVNSHYQNDHFQENRENHIYGVFVKIRELTLIIIFVIFPQKLQFKNESFEISRNSTYDLPDLLALNASNPPLGEVAIQK